MDWRPAIYVPCSVFHRSPLLLLGRQLVHYLKHSLFKALLFYFITKGFLNTAQDLHALPKILQSTGGNMFSSSFILHYRSVLPSSCI
ncbi:hypothetical protein KC335_g28 [Hortaea werneckii]|nr:hypothetical protein KC335_g28 [Hortaea werneckii]